MKLYLVRHGAVEGGEGLCMGRHDAPLSEEGRSSLLRLAESWASPNARLFASDLLRARDSAGVLAEAWGCDVAIDARLREMDFGAWDGRTWAELEREDGPRLAAWMGDWVGARARDGESFRDVGERVEAWAAEALAPGGGDAVVVAHAGSLRALLCHLLPWPMERAFQLRLDHGRASGLRLGGRAGAELAFLNAHRVPPP